MTTDDTDTAGGHHSPPVRILITGCRGVSWGLDVIGRVIAVACLGVMFALLLMNVILRYVFTTGIPMAYEIHAILLPWLVAGGLVVAAAQNRNIAVTLLPDMLPKGARRWLFVAVQAALLVISVTVLWTGQPILRASTFQTLSTLGVRQVWGYASLPYAFGCIAVIAACDLLRLLARDRALLEAAPPESLS